jgi:hypothetical protein
VWVDVGPTTARHIRIWHSGTVDLPSLDDSSPDVAHAYKVLSDASLKSVTMVLEPDTAADLAELKPVAIHDVLVAYLLFARDLRRNHHPPALARGVALRHARRIAGKVFLDQSDTMNALRCFVNLARIYPTESLELALGPISSSGTVWTSEMSDTDVLGPLAREVYDGARITGAWSRAKYLAHRVRCDDHLSPTECEVAVLLSEQWTGTLAELIDIAMTPRPPAHLQL